MVHWERKYQPLESPTRLQHHRHSSHLAIERSEGSHWRLACLVYSLQSMHTVSQHQAGAGDRSLVQPTKMIGGKQVRSMQAN